MVKKMLKVTGLNGLKPTMKVDRITTDEIRMSEFFELHEKFMEDKSLQGLAPRTLEEHEIHIRYFKSYLNAANQSSIDCKALNMDVLKSYIYYMVHEKEYKPCTVNLRLRTLKCYLRWLFEENHLSFNYAMKIKLLKVLKDTIKPLSDGDVKKMLNATDKSTYPGFRDYSMMVLMLDCGIRVGEATQVKIEDVDTKMGLLNIKAENAKTRTFRQVPLSKYTCTLLIELINIANDNGCEFIFQSVYGGKIGKGQVIQNFSRLGKKMGLKVKCTPHIFRHNFATNFVRSNQDIFTLQKILGHETIVTTRKYVQLENSDMIIKHKKADVLDKYFK